jgi:multiple RNA-binding domain-containing protein 1
VKRDGRSRQFGFVGYKSEKEAQEAQKHFNNTFFDTSKVSVEFAKAVKFD